MGCLFSEFLDECIDHGTDKRDGCNGHSQQCRRTTVCDFGRELDNALDVVEEVPRGTVDINEVDDACVIWMSRLSTQDERQAPEWQ